ncbi:MAG TPA: hypothetical protein PLV13_10385 [Ilumatobacteraceae bacterium]|nr:hypothetical protein [Ilumatobacteraceae bacterium]
MSTLLIVVGILLMTFALVASISLAAKSATRRALDAAEQLGASYVTVARLVGAYGTEGGLVRGSGAVAVHPGRLIYTLGRPARTHTLVLQPDTTVEVTRTLDFPGRKAVLFVPSVVVRTGSGGMALMVKLPEELAAAVSAAVPGGTTR